MMEEKQGVKDEPQELQLKRLTWFDRWAKLDAIFERKKDDFVP